MQYTTQYHITLNHVTLINPIICLPTFPMPKAPRLAGLIGQPGVLSRRELRRAVRDMVG